MRRCLGLSLLLSTLLASGCVSAPKIKPDLIGINNLRGVEPEESFPPSSEQLLLDSGRPAPRYRIGAGDELVVIIWGRPDLGSQVPAGQNGELHSSIVTDEGAIFMPFLGRVMVSGKTLEEARAIIAARYAEIIESPQVEVRIRSCESQAVFIGGAVHKEGNQYLCTTRLTVGDVLTQAGGLTGDADLTRGLLTRGLQTYHLDYRRTERGESRAMEIPLQEGDVLYFPDADERFVYVFGEVHRQGLYPIPNKGLTLLEALARAHGLDTVTASHGSIYLIRPREEKFVSYRVSFAEALQHPDVQLANGDRIFVPATGLTRWDRFWRQAIPFTTVRTTLDVNALVSGNP